MNKRVNMLGWKEKRKRVSKTINLKRYWQKKEDLKDNETGSSNTDKTGHFKTMKENCTKSYEYQQLDVKEPKQFLSKIWKQKELNRKEYLIYYMVNNFKNFKKVRRWKYSRIHSEQHSKKYQIGKRLTMIAYMDDGLKKFSSIHHRMVLKMNRWLEEPDISEWMTNGKTTLILEDPPTKKWTTPNN